MPKCRGACDQRMVGTSKRTEAVGVESLLAVSCSRFPCPLRWLGCFISRSNRRHFRANVVYARPTSHPKHFALAIPHHESLTPKYDAQVVLRFGSLLIETHRKEGSHTGENR